MPSNSEYWAKRFETLQEAQLKKGQDYYAELEKIYIKTSNSIEKDIAIWYQRFADNNQISLFDAKKLLNTSELKEFKWTVEDYIKYGKENAIDQRWMKELENASARVHISRLEALKLQLQQQAEVLYGNQLDGMDALAKDIYTDGYYHTAYEIQKGFNLGWDLQALNTNQVEAAISKPWSTDNKTFSDRIWTNKTQLINTLHTQLTQAIIRGDAPDKVIKTISKQLNTSKSQAGRLVMTESAFLSSNSQKDCFNDLDVEQYEIVATLDMRTSEICQELDGKVFDMKDYEPGVTAPPFHVYCRSVTAPYFDDNYTERAARGVDGKTYYVPSDMKYKDWKAKVIKDNPGAELEIKKQKNLAADAEQYKKYKKALGKEYVPESLDEFQNLKYTNTNEYGVLKAQAKGMSYYNTAISNESAISKRVKTVANDTGMDIAGFENHIKEKDSYLRKIRTNYSPTGNEYEVNDIIRYTYTAEPADLVDKTLKSIDAYKQAGYNTIKVKNTWLNKYDPYNGINTFIQAPNGQKFEMQYHTPESYKLKDGKLHELYEQWRVLPEDAPEAIELRKKMFKLSDTLTIPREIKKVK